MALRSTAFVTAALAVGPALAFAALAAGGLLGTGWALAGFALCLATAFATAAAYVRGVFRLRRALQRAAEESGPFSAPPPVLRLPALGELHDELLRLSRRLQGRAEQMQRLRAADGLIVEALPDPLLILGADRAILRTNAAARRLFAIPEGGGAGDAAALLRHPQLAAALDAALAAGEPQAVELFLPVPVARELSARAVPLEPALPDGGRLALLLTDRSGARAVERMRSDFVTNASHELRTPLSSLIGFIETLRGPARDDPVAQQRFLGIMADQSERMRQLIDDLLDLARVETQEHLPPSGEADLAAVLRAEVEAMQPLIAARGTRLLVEAADGLPLAAPADAGQIAQVVRNLLENAIRHGRAKGEVRAEVTAGPRSGVTLTVTDDGPGIPREHIPRLTERFYRVDRARGRGDGGTGLGLSIVKHIVVRHRGQLSIESEPGQGARFRVWLPAARDRAPGAGSTTSG